MIVQLPLPIQRTRRGIDAVHSRPRVAEERGERRRIRGAARADDDGAADAAVGFENPVLTAVVQPERIDPA